MNGEAYKPRAEYLYYEVEVEELAVEYPESGERIRKWVRHKLKFVVNVQLLIIGNVRRGYRFVELET